MFKKCLYFLLALISRKENQILIYSKGADYVWHSSDHYPANCQLITTGRDDTGRRVSWSDSSRCRVLSLLANPVLQWLRTTRFNKIISESDRIQSQISLTSSQLWTSDVLQNSHSSQKPVNDWLFGRRFADTVSQTTNKNSDTSLNSILVLWECISFGLS